MDLKLDIIDKDFLESFIEVTNNKTSLISGIVMNIRPISQLKDILELYIIKIKVIAVLIILCCLAY